MSSTYSDPEKQGVHSEVDSDVVGVPIATMNERDAQLEKRVWFKMDWWLLPIVALFYLLSFLDRTNLGNARIAGLQKELKMTDYQYSIALTITYVPYIAAELPSNLLLKIIGPNLMLPTMLTLWGVITTAQGAVKSYGGLLACRFFLGLMEGGVFPGLVLYLSSFYPRKRLHMRISAFFSTASLSGAFSGILAYGILRLDGKKGHSGWEWIFIIEGVFTIFVGLCAYLLMPSTIQSARFLSQEEKDYVERKLKEDGAMSNDIDDGFSWREVWMAFKLPQVWFLAIIFFFSGTTLFGLAYFTPSIVQGLGYKGATAQLMSVPMYAVAFVITMLVAWLSDRYQARGLATIFCSLLATIGFAMFLGSHNKHVQYGSLFLSITGVYCSAPATSTWSANNAAPHTRRATAIAIGFIMTNSGGILSTWLLGTLSKGPRYTKGTIVLLIFSALMTVFALGNMWYLNDQNKKKALRREELGGKRENEEKGLGDRSAWFIYNL